MKIYTKKGSKENIDFKYNISQYWVLLKKYKFLFILMLIITFITESLFVVDKFLFKNVIDDGTSYLAKTLDVSVFVNHLIIIAAIFSAVIILRSLGKWMSVHIISYLDSRLIFDLKEKYFNHIIDLSHGFHTTHKTGSMISRLNRGSSAIENMTDLLIFSFAPLIFQLVLVSFSLALFSFKPALVIFIVAVVFILYSLFIQNIQQKSKLIFNAYQDREKGLISDIFTNVDSIKYFAKEEDIKAMYAKTSKKTRDSSVKYWNYYRWFDGGNVFILGVGSLFLIYFPLVDFLNGTLSMGTLIFIYTIYGNIAGPVFGFVNGIRNFYRSMADFQELFEYGKIENDIKDKPGAKELIVKEGTLEFKDVSFNYGKRNFLNDFNLKINKNEKVAFVGHSGCGKTTLVKLINRLYDVNSGQILIDGKDIKNYTQTSVRDSTGIVPQECILFDDTIYNNVKFADLKASRNEVMRAMRLAQLDKMLKNLPKRENTIVGERGVKLSGGEKQRVSIARAILANKKILILDEATSSLDSKTEHEIQKSLENLLEGRTAILIAHRLSTIMNADKIVVMDRGNIIQMGKHSDLIRQRGIYRELWTLQKGGYIQ